MSNVNFSQWREPEELSFPSFLSAPKAEAPQKEIKESKEPGILSSLLNSGAFDINTILGLLDNKTITNLLPMLLKGFNKKPAQVSEPIVDFNDYRRVR